MQTSSERTRVFSLNYYNNVGLESGKSEASCGAYTKLILTEHSGSEALLEHINSDLIHALLLRVCKWVKLLPQHRLSAETFYQDIMAAITELVKYCPNIVNMATKETMFIFTYNTRSQRNQDQSQASYKEGVMFLKLIAFLIKHGCPFDASYLTSATDIDADVPFDPSTDLVRAKCDVINEALSMLYEEDYARAHLFKTWLSVIHVDHNHRCVHNDHSGHLAHWLSLVTHSLGLLDKHNMDIYDLPAEMIVQLFGRDMVIPTHTFFQNFCSQEFQFISSNSCRYDIIQIQIIYTCP